LISLCSTFFFFCVVAFRRLGLVMLSCF
jgi:hypothetical protein